MQKKVGIITIGQSPRTDMTPALRRFLPKDAVILERGVLDGRSEDEIQALRPEPGQTTLISRLQNGESAVMAKEKILPMIQILIDELNQANVSLIILACTGKFPLFTSRIPIVYPDFLLNHVVKGLLREGLLGVILPLPEQAESIIYKWKEVDFMAIPMASSPYTFVEEQLINAVQQLDQYPVKAILLDCMGYTEEMKAIAQAHTTKPVILSRNVIYGVAGEIL
ncbi:AroM family protein [Bacillus sp. S3]|uniref:AroM family protein n=1 Tax=Bacillus sp. S3 TaxID=486398 RepID=UPI001187B763|nr:AroM family protein [Bacillus sp. S3]QCJ44380.1 AroM family protein [Bacillus sp. S3]